MSRTNGTHRAAAGLSLRAQLRPDPTDKPASMSISVRSGTPARSRPVGDGAAVASYDAAGRLLSVEVRGRVRLDELEAVARKEAAAVQRFLREVVPPRLVRFL
jgi:hypothetical protein